MRNQNNRNEQLLEQLKNEIAQELNIIPGADTTSRLNGKIGGTMTQKLIQLGQMKLEEMQQEQSTQSTPDYMINQQSQQQNQLH